ncbi:MAG: transcription termination/antitermination protein NusG [Bdellovibrionaceae bacterium]|nr:transcription termination/antitermination protein NusG [Pseudobdellovibrionaceae bacterium]
MEDFKWYVLKTKTNCEGRAKQMISDLVDNKNLKEQIKEVLIPEKDVIQVVKGKKIPRSKKIYPGYIFIKMKLNDRLSYLIKSVTNVSHFVGGRFKPIEVPPEQLKVIDQQMKESSENPQAQITFSEGESVLVIDGPFKNFNGTVEEVNKEKGRVKVSVSIFGRPTPVEFDFDQVHRET